MSDETFLYLFRELEGLIHKTILHQFKHDIGVDRIRVKALIGCFVIGLKFHHGILAHGNIKVLLHIVGTEDKCLHPFDGRGLRSVGMNREEEVGLGFVGYVGTCLQGNKDISIARIDHFYLGVLL